MEKQNKGTEVYFSKHDCDEFVSIITRCHFNGDDPHDLRNYFFTQDIEYSGGYNSVTLNLNGLSLTSTDLRQMADDIDKMKDKFKVECSLFPK